jgi:hypothetical protein
MLRLILLCSEQSAAPVRQYRGGFSFVLSFLGLGDVAQREHKHRLVTVFDCGF